MRHTTRTYTALLTPPALVLVAVTALGLVPKQPAAAQPGSASTPAADDAAQALTVQAEIRRDGAKIFAPVLLLRPGTSGAASSKVGGVQHEFAVSTQFDPSSGAYLVRTRYLVAGQERLAPAFLLQRGAEAKSDVQVGDHLWSVDLHLR